MRSSVLADVALRTEDDLFVARQLGRDSATGLGLERLDALRVATAISELGREIVASGGGSLVLALRGDTLLIDLAASERPAQWETALAAATAWPKAAATAADRRAAPDGWHSVCIARRRSRRTGEAIRARSASSFSVSSHRPRANRARASSPRRTPVLGAAAPQRAAAILADSGDRSWSADKITIFLPPETLPIASIDVLRSATC